MSSIDLNADLGELPGEEGAALDAAIMPLLSSCSVACGGHAGDQESMRRTLRAAQSAGVAAGAHPSYPDREGFGRRALAIDEAGLADALEGQLAALTEAAEDTGVPLAHLKPHGALYHAAAADGALATLLVDLARRYRLALYGPPSGRMREAAATAQLRYVAEGFADRAYAPDGGLRPRTERGAVLTDHAAQADQALRLATGRPVDTAAGPLALRVETLCLHGDTPGAVEAARAVRRALDDEGLTVGPPS